MSDDIVQEIDSDAIMKQAKEEASHYFALMLEGKDTTDTVTGYTLLTTGMKLLEALMHTLETEDTKVNFAEQVYKILKSSALSSKASPTPVCLETVPAESAQCCDSLDTSCQCQEPTAESHPC